MYAYSYALGAAAGIANFFGLAIIPGPTSTEGQRMAALPLLILPVVGVYKLRVDDYASGMITTGLGIGLLAVGKSMLYPTAVDAKAYSWSRPIQSLGQACLDTFTGVALAGGPALMVLLTMSHFDLFRYLGLNARRW